MNVNKTQKIEKMIALHACIAAVIAMLVFPAFLQAETPTESAANAKDFTNIGALPERYGYLSDPDVAAESLWDAVTGGKVHFNNRFRIELVEMAGTNYSSAVTNRLRLGYETKAWQNFSAMVEFENVMTPDETLYNVPATGDGDPLRAVVADPPDSEINQAFLRYKSNEMGVGIDIKAGRQRVVLDDARFIGNVGWRQFEQTYDAVSMVTTLNNPDLLLVYGYVWNAQGIFADKGPDLQTSTHVFNASYKFCDAFKLTGFVYSIDMDNAALAASLNSVTGGVRATGGFGLDRHLNTDGLSLDYVLSYAYQTDGHNNTSEYEASYYLVDVKVKKKDLGYAGLGYEVLGSDGGAASFQTPLGTNHKFNGWADAFLTTPATGLQDLYLYVGGSLPWDVDGKLVYHHFGADSGSADFGWEIDAQLKKNISKNWSVLMKYAFLDGDSTVVNRNKFWIETTFSF